jgi:hypothetical protein
MRWAGHVAYRNAYTALVRKPEGMGPLGRFRCEWEDNIKMYPKRDGRQWTGLIWFRIMTHGGLL